MQLRALESETSLVYLRTMSFYHPLCSSSRPEPDAFAHGIRRGSGSRAFSGPIPMDSSAGEQFPPSAMRPTTTTILQAEEERLDRGALGHVDQPLPGQDEQRGMVPSACG